MKFCGKYSLTEEVKFFKTAISCVGPRVRACVRECIYVCVNLSTEFQV